MVRRHKDASFLFLLVRIYHSNNMKCTFHVLHNSYTCVLVHTMNNVTETERDTDNIEAAQFHASESFHNFNYTTSELHQQVRYSPTGVCRCTTV